jgi:hypothetical protein
MLGRGGFLAHERCRKWLLLFWLMRFPPSAPPDVWVYFAAHSYEVIRPGMREKALHYGRPMLFYKTCDAWRIWMTLYDEPVEIAAATPGALDRPTSG